jgi:hypothetical protein
LHAVFCVLHVVRLAADLFAGGGEGVCGHGRKHTKTIVPRCCGPLLERQNFLGGVYMLWVKSSLDFQHSWAVFFTLTIVGVSQCRCWYAIFFAVFGVETCGHTQR